MGAATQSVGAWVPSVAHGGRVAAGAASPTAAAQRTGKGARSVAHGEAPVADNNSKAHSGGAGEQSGGSQHLLRAFLFFY